MKQSQVHTFLTTGLLHKELHVSDSDSDEEEISIWGSKVLLSFFLLQVSSLFSLYESPFSSFSAKCLSLSHNIAERAQVTQDI